MNPRFSNPGRSFKWAHFYMSHDKQASTSERLGFVEFCNLPIEETGDGPADSERAGKIMSFTHIHWEDIQRAHFDATNTDPAKSYRRPPRPPEKPVLTFSLRFHPSDADKITPELLKDAARRSLEAIGMADLQAVIYEHTDFEKTPEYPQHPSHLHVVVNKIDPVTGKTRSTSKNYLRMSRFCQEFAREHGLMKVEQREVNNARRDKGEIVYYQGLSRTEYERFRSYRSKTQVTVERERKAQQESDRKDLQDRHVTKRREFDKRMQQAYGQSRQDVIDQINLTRRTITLDHMSGVFQVFTRLKQRFTGELKRELATLTNLRRTLGAIDERMASDQKSLDDKLRSEVAKLHARHAAELTRDADYFEWQRRRRKTETAGEAGSKSFNVKSRPESTEEPKPWLKAHLLRMHKAARQDGRDDAAIRMAKEFGFETPAAERPADAPKTPEESLRKLYTRKDGRGAKRQQGRKRKPRQRNRDSDRDR